MDNDITMVAAESQYRVCIYPAQMICDEGKQMESCQNPWRPMFVGVISYSRVNDLITFVCGTTKPVYGISKEQILSDKKTFKQYEIQQRPLLEGIIKLKVNQQNIAQDLGCKYNDIIKLSTAKLNPFCGYINDNNNHPDWNLDHLIIDKNPDLFKKLLRINTERTIQLKKELKVWSHVHVTFLSNLTIVFCNRNYKIGL